jgi:hypothetical protein
MRLVAKAGEALMLVEGSGPVIDGMDHGDRYINTLSNGEKLNQR